MPGILFLVPADYDALTDKGVASAILDRDEDGFFDRVVTIHPLAHKSRMLELDATHRVYEFDAGIGVWGQEIRFSRIVALPFALLKILFQARRIIKAERLDVIRATDAYLMGLMAWILSRLLQVPFCISIHADYAKRFDLTPAGGLRAILRRIASTIPPFVLRRADLVLPIRQHLADDLVRMGVEPARIQVIPHGVDLEKIGIAADWNPHTVLDIPENISILSYVGRLNRENYIEDVLEIVRRLAARRADFVLVVAGGGVEEPLLRHGLATEPALRKHVRWLGFVSWDTAISLRKHSTAAICLMGGFSLIEACAAGCPVVAYDVEWHSELVRTGVTGCLVAERDVASATDCLERLITEPDTASRMGAEARKIAIREHDQARTSTIKIEAYRSLLVGS